MVWRGAGSACLLVVLCISVGCFSTRSVTPHEVSKLRHNKRALKARKSDFHVRVDPNSTVRFWRVDGTSTQWVKASDLSVNDEGVMTRSRSGTASGLTDGLRWEDVEYAEINNLSGGYTLVAVAASVAITALLVGAIAAAGAGGGSGLNSCDPGGCNPGSCNLGGGGSSGSSSEGFDERQSASKGRGPHLTAEVEPLSPPSREGARQLFDFEERRRANILILSGFGAETVLNDNTTMSESAAVGFRFWDLLELGGGVRRTHATGVVDPVAQQATRYRPFGRLGMHMDLDARKIVGVPVIAETEFSKRGVEQVRLMWGLRIRPTEYFYIGAYPFNPVFDVETETFSFPSGLEIGTHF